MLDILHLMMKEECGINILTPLTVNHNCRTDEYDNLKELIQEFENIQTNLYHKANDKTKLETILRLIDISKKLDDRLKLLFEAGYQCSEEINFIKASIMPNLTVCLAWYMQPEIDLSLMSRSSRLACIKQLLTGIEERKLDLLRSEVQFSLENVSKSTEDFVPQIVDVANPRTVKLPSSTTKELEVFPPPP